MLTQQSASATKSRFGSLNNANQHLIQIKSFVKMEGSIPSSVSRKKDKKSADEKDVQPTTEDLEGVSTSLLQQTPIELQGSKAYRLAYIDAAQQKDENVVKVSQFTEQSKSGNHTGSIQDS